MRISDAASGNSGSYTAAGHMERGFHDPAAITPMDSLRGMRRPMFLRAVDAGRIIGSN
jgi:hypothetical protein